MHMGDEVLGCLLMVSSDMFSNAGTAPVPATYENLALLKEDSQEVDG